MPPTKSGSRSLWFLPCRVVAGTLALVSVLVAVAVAQAPAASGAAALAHVAALSEEIGPRPAGSPEFVRATEYVSGQLQRLGYPVEQQTFPFLFYDEPTPPELEVVNPTDVILHPVTMLYSAATPPNGVDAELVDVGLGRADDLWGKQVKGKVAFAGRGEIRFSEKARLAAAAGAVALVIHNNESGPARAGTLLDPSKIPVVMIPYDEGVRLGAWLAAGAVRVRLVVQTVSEHRTSVNVIGMKPGTAPSQDVVVVGGHLDTVPRAPGANDNASGIAALLETARLVAAVPTTHPIQFVAFGAEEEGVIGSHFYATHHTFPIAGMVNLDMVGNGSQMLIANSTGSGRLLDIAERVASRLGISVQRARVGNSDHISFEGAGVPVVFIHTGDDGVYHTPQDTIARIKPDRLAQAASLAAGIIVDLATASQ